MHKIIFNCFILTFVFLCTSCGIFWVRKHDPKAKFCCFDTQCKTIYCSPPGGGGISKISVFLYSEDFTYWIVKNGVYSNPVNKIELDEEFRKIDSALLKEHELHIQIWNKSPVIFDYGFYLNPKDWEKKIVYGWWNAR